MEDKSMIESIQTFAARQALAFIERDPEKNFSKLLDWADKLTQATCTRPSGKPSARFWSIRKATGTSCFCGYFSWTKGYGKPFWKILSSTLR